MLAAACASSGGSSGYRGAPLLDEGAAALHRADFDTARERLDGIRQECGHALAGRHALLLLGTLALDPRNAERDPDRAALLAARYLRRPETFPWTRPLAESLYLLALEMGADEPSAESLAEPDISAPAHVQPSCDEVDRQTVQAAAGELPDLVRPSVPSRLRDLERQRAALRREVAQLESELDRVRATVRP